MSISKLMRSHIALLTLTALLFCYTVGAAQAFQPGGVRGEAAAGAPACHTLDENGSSHGAVHVACATAQKVNDVVKLPLTPAAAIPAPPRVLHPLFTASALTRACTHAGLAGALPPLYLLHCRLLN